MLRQTITTTLMGFFAFCLFLAGCEFKKAVRSTERTAKPIEIRELTLNDLRPGQELAGTWRIDLNVLAIDYDIEQLEIYLDDRLLQKFGTFGPYNFTLETAAYPEGDHELKILLWEEQPDLGLLNLLNQPSLQLVRDLTFNQAPPTQTNFTGTVWLADALQISWEPNQDANFRSCSLRRIDWDNSITTIFTSSDPAVTSFVDYGLPPTMGDNIAQYRLSVSNGAEEVFATPVSVQFGNRLPGKSEFQPLANPSRGEIYLLSDDSLQVLSTVSHALLRGVDIRAGLPGSDFKPLATQLSPDHNSIFFLAQSLQEPPEKRFLVQIDPVAMTISNSFRVPDESGAFQMSAIHGTFIIDGAGTLWRINDGDGTPRDSLPEVVEHGNVLICLGVQEDALYLAEEPATLPDTVAFKAISLAGGGMAVQHEAVLPLIVEIQRLALSPDGQFIYLSYLRSGRRYTTIEKWDVQTFTPLRFIPVPIQPGGDDVRTWLISDNYIFVAYAASSYNGNATGVLLKLDASNPDDVLEQWRFLTCPGYLVSLNDQDKLFAFGHSLMFGHSNWLIDL